MPHNRSPQNSVVYGYSTHAHSCRFSGIWLVQAEPNGLCLRPPASGLEVRLWTCPVGLVLEPRPRNNGCLLHVLVPVNHFHGHSKSLTTSYQTDSLLTQTSHKAKHKVKGPAAVTFPVWNCSKGCINDVLQQSEDITGTIQSARTPTLLLTRCPSNVF